MQSRSRRAEALLKRHPLPLRMDSPSYLGDVAALSDPNASAAVVEETKNYIRAALDTPGLGKEALRMIFLFIITSPHYSARELPELIDLVADEYRRFESPEQLVDEYRRFQQRAAEARSISSSLEEEIGRLRSRSRSFDAESESSSEESLTRRRPSFVARLRGSSDIGSSSEEEGFVGRTRQRRSEASGRGL
jgi:hypothetical protein